MLLGTSPASTAGTWSQRAQGINATHRKATATLRVLLPSFSALRAAHLLRGEKKLWGLIRLAYKQ